MATCDVFFFVDFMKIYFLWSGWLRVGVFKACLVVVSWFFREGQVVRLSVLSCFSYLIFVLVSNYFCCVVSLVVGVFFVYVFML